MLESPYAHFTLASSGAGIFSQVHHTWGGRRVVRKVDSCMGKDSCIFADDAESLGT